MSECKHRLMAPQLNGDVGCFDCKRYWDSFMHYESERKDKRIAELEQENKLLHEKFIDLKNHARGTIEAIQDAKIAELEQENAQLKNIGNIRHDGIQELLDNIKDLERKLEAKEQSLADANDQIERGRERLAHE